MSDDDKDDLANIYNSTTGLHIFTSIAFTCMVLLTWYLPTIYSNRSSYLATLVWAIILPLIVIFSGSYKLSLTGEDDFVILKILFLVFVILYLQMFVYTNVKKSNKFFNFKWLTNGLLGLIMVNILLAVVAQFDNRSDESEQIDNVINTWNPVIGLILVLCLGYIVVMGRKQDQFGVDNLRIYSRLGVWFVLAYSVWDTVFRYQLNQSTVVYLFFICTILIPAFLYYVSNGKIDYVQFRTYSLLFYLIVIIGVTPYGMNIFPAYNESGYNEAVENNSPITNILKNETFRYTGLGLAALTTVGAVVETYKGTKNWSMN